MFPRTLETWDFISEVDCDATDKLSNILFKVVDAVTDTTVFVVTFSNILDNVVWFKLVAVDVDVTLDNVFDKFYTF